MVFCSTIAIAMYRAGKIEPIKMSTREYFTTVFPVGFLYSMSLVCATSAYMLLFLRRYTNNTVAQAIPAPPQLSLAIHSHSHLTVSPPARGP